MASQVLRCLTATAVLVHSVLGCCWHHAHAGCAGCGQVDQAETADSVSRHVHRHGSRCGHDHEMRPHRHGACRRDAQDILREDLPSIMGPDGALHAWCGKHPPEGPSPDDCHEVTCTYVSTPAPVLADGAGLPPFLLSDACPAQFAPRLRGAVEWTEGDERPLSAAARCALSQVWRL